MRARPPTTGVTLQSNLAANVVGHCNVMEGFSEGLELVAYGVTVFAGVAHGISWLVMQRPKQKHKVRQALDEQAVRLIRARTMYQERQILAGKATTDDEGNYIALTRQSTNNEFKGTREEMNSMISVMAPDAAR